MDFQAIFDGTITVNNDERADAAREWLKSEYGITVKNDELLASLLEVHNHGSDIGEHFGHPLVSSSFGQAFFQIVFVTERWHLSYCKEPRTDFTLIHPKSEDISWKALQNRSSVAEAKLMLKSGILRKNNTSPIVQEISKPSALVSGSDVHIYIPEVQAKEEITKSSPADILGEFGDTGYISVTINMEPKQN